MFNWPISTILVEGTTDLDVRFFQGHGQWGPSPFSFTVALLSSSSMTPLDWNQEEPMQCGLNQSTPNPNSRITINPRITVDAELCCVSFSIAIPLSLIVQPQSSQQRSDSVYREFGVAVKAYDAAGKTTQTNIAQFMVRYPRSLAPTGPSAPSGLARRVSNAINVMSRNGRRRSSGGNAALKQQYSGASAVATTEYGGVRGRQLRKLSVHSTASGNTKASR